MKLAADANVLLSALLGGRAKLVVQHPQVELFTTGHTVGEVQGYAILFARKRAIPLDAALLEIATLPVNILSKAAYRDQMSEARRRIAKRDPDDVDILALALHLRVPLWSNDKDFRDAGIACYTTAELLKQLNFA